MYTKFCLFVFIQRELTEEEERYRIVETAAKIIKSAIKELDANNESYPSPNAMESSDKNVEYLPKSLRILLDTLFVGKEKSVPVASIGQAIMQQVRPKALIVPIQLGLGIQMHQHFGSKFLIDSLYKHGFCLSYSEVLNYERCAAVHQGTKVPGLTESSSSQSTHFMHHVADDAGHNSRTLDSRNTFHGMGIICSVTPAVSSSFAIPRLQDVSTEELVKLTKIARKILPPRRKVQKLKFKELNEPVNMVDPLTSAWAATWLLNPRQPLEWLHANS